MYTYKKYLIACIASISGGLGAKKDRGTGFSMFSHVKNGERTIKENGGWGARKETLSDKPLDFENVHSPANGARELAGLVKCYRRVSIKELKIVLQ